MELNNLDIQINQYINGELTGEALQEFEQLLTNNPEFAKEVALHKKIDQTLQAKKASKNDPELKALFQQFGEKYIINATENEVDTKVIDLPQHENVPTQKANINKGILKWLAPVASIAAATALLIFYIGFGKVNPKKLAEQHFEVYTLDNIPRSGNLNDLMLAQQAYDNKDYSKAKDLFSMFPDNTSAQMAKGNCEFLLEEPEKAINTFKQLTNRKIDVHQKAEVHWYLALSYLKLDDRENATKNLQLIPSSSNYYEDAQTIIDKLD